MTMTPYFSRKDSSDTLVALQAQAYVNLSPIPAHAEMSDLLSNGIALASALLSHQEGPEAFQENKRKLASLVLEKMHLIARETATGGKEFIYPNFSC